MTLQNDADDTLARGAQAQLRMLSDVLSQGLDCPMGLRDP
jgi:hypothetical protein